MILKSYEIEKNINSLLDNNLYLLYGENEGLKFDIRDLIKKNLLQINILLNRRQDIPKHLL